MTAVVTGKCGYSLINRDGEQYPCDRPAVGWRWYQDVTHEDALDVACEWHENEGGRRMHAAETELEITRRACETLGKIVDRQAVDICRIAGVTMPEDGDADYALAWDRVAEMPHEIRALRNGDHAVGGVGRSRFKGPVMTAVATIARHAAAAALTADALYTIRYWLIGGRDDRRAGRYPEVKYFAIIGQLGIETALIIHLLRKDEP